MQRDTTVLQRRYDLSYTLAWYIQPQTHQLAGMIEEFIWCALSRKLRRGLWRSHMCGRVQTHVGQWVGGIAAIFRLSTDTQVLEHGTTCKCLRGHFVSGFVNVVKLDPAAIDQLLGKVMVYQVICSSKGVHILIKAPGEIE